MRLTLQPGNCHEDENDIDSPEVEEESTEPASSTAAPDPEENSTLTKEELKKSYNKSEFIVMGKHSPIKSDVQESPKTTTGKAVSATEAWKPIITVKTKPAVVGRGISQKMDDVETVLTTNEEKFLNYGERMPKKTKTEKRSFGDAEGAAVTTGVPEATSTEDSGNKFITVQLFPYRLADVFEKAERYARLTLFPLLTEQFSNIFRSGMSNDTIERSDKPIILSTAIKSDKKFVGHENDSEESQRNFQTIQQTNMKMLDDIKPPIEKLMNNYKNYNDEKRTFNNAYNIRIDLPTYAPKKQSKFIPIHGESNSNEDKTDEFH